MNLDAAEVFLFLAFAKDFFFLALVLVNDHYSRVAS